MKKESLLKILLLVWAALSPVLMSAQELQITEARRTIEPMTVPLQRLDYNNQICALVKVVLPLADVKFEGNVVGEPVLKTSEYMVYLTPGTKMLKILAPGYYPVMADFTELGVGPMESKTIYYLTLKTAELQPNQSATVSCTDFTPVYGELNVNYRPVGSTIALNGRQVGTTPATLSNINVGTYNVTISSSGYTTYTQSVTIAEGTPVSLSGSLQRQTAATSAATTMSAADDLYSITPINLALCAKLNGQTVYITQSQWKAMSSAEQTACKNKWLYVTGNDESGNNHSFLLALNDCENGRMKWNKAMLHYGNSLPTKTQGEVMAKNYEAINIAIKAFGGDEDSAWEYWTRTKENSSNVWSIYMGDGSVNCSNKSSMFRVRAVALLP